MNTTTRVIDRNLEEANQIVSQEVSLEGMILQGRQNKYTVLNILAETDQSIVYHGINDQGERVVIKEYLQNHRSNAFEREKFADTLFSRHGRHPQIIPGYDFFIVDFLPIGVFPYVQGRTLENVIEQRIFDGELPLDQEEIIPLVTNLCEAADYIHGLNLVHRDFKPSNVMVTSTAPKIMIPYVFDFGIAWHPEIADYDLARAYYGTPEYTDPEKWKFPQPHPREDIYSIALMAYELLSGDLPLQANDLFDLQQLHGWEAPIPDITKVSPFISQDVKEVLEKALSYDPAQRYPAAGEFKKAYLKAVGRK